MNEAAEAVIRAYGALDRSRFLESHQGWARVDAPLPIGYGQTISQPSLVLDMTLALDPGPGLRVLEIGTGSGYQTVLLAVFAEHVYTMERIGPLLEKAQERLEAMGIGNVSYRLGDGWEGWPEAAPFHRIIVTAAARRVPSALLEQLAPGGILVIPVGPEGGIQQLRRIEKAMDGSLRETVLYDVRFVPLVQGPPWSD